MIRYLKHIVRIILIFALIMCWGISLGYANNIEKETPIKLALNTKYIRDVYDKLRFIINSTLL